jgi:hypothetical protein
MAGADTLRPWAWRKVIGVALGSRHRQTAGGGPYPGSEASPCGIGAQGSRGVMSPGVGPIFTYHLTKGWSDTTGSGERRESM